MPLLPISLVIFVQLFHFCLLFTLVQIPKQLLVQAIHSITTLLPRMSQLPDVEKDHAGADSVNGKYDLHHDHHDSESALKRIRTAGSISISPELFEQIYLSPKNRVSNNLRSTFANPTPL